jgi:mycothiol synthase
VIGGLSDVGSEPFSSFLDLSAYPVPDVSGRKGFSVRALSWRWLGEADLPAVVELARECLSADGGQPFAASPEFLGRCYLSGAQTYSGFSGTRLVCVSSLRRASSGPPSAGQGDVAVTTGLVHPAWRRRGLGGYAFDWAGERAAPAGLLAETEALSDGAHALYLSRGLSQVFAEDVMQLAASTPLPPAHPPPGLVLAPWGQADPARFYAVYQAAFRDRPGFPGWTQDRWVEWISDDEDFRAEWTLLATLGGTDAGFVAGEAPGWIAQMGVVPSARGRDIGAALIGEAVRRMRSAGETSITLNVNVDNPYAAALYRRLGFTRTGRRARYQPRGRKDPGPAA